MTRTRTRAPRLAAVFAVIVLTACSGTAGAEGGSASQPLSTAAPVYLALGDSVPFGWSDALGDSSVPERFFGYPKYLAGTLGLPLLNAACPSEASGSFFSAVAPDDGCREYRLTHDLHVDYDGTQLAYAIHVIEASPRVELVTLQLGANDLELLVKSCAGAPDCIVGALPGALEATAANVATILTALRAAGYAGPVAVIGYYNPTTDPMKGTLIAALDQALAGVAAAFDVEFVDLYGPFAEAAQDAGGDPCATGLIARVEDGDCEIHPSRAGHRLIASLVAGVLTGAR